MQGGLGIGLLMTGLLVAGRQAQLPASPPIALQATRADASIPECAKSLRIHRTEILDQFQIILVSGLGLTSESSVPDCFKDDWVRLPIRESQSLYQIPTGEILLKLKSGTERTVLDRTLQDLGLYLAGEPKGDRAFKVVTRPLSALKSASALKRLRELDFVQYAEPNWVMVRPGG